MADDPDDPTPFSMWDKLYVVVVVILLLGFALAIYRMVRP